MKNCAVGTMVQINVNSMMLLYPNTAATIFFNVNENTCKTSFFRLKNNYISSLYQNMLSLQIHNELPNYLNYWVAT